MSQETNIIVQTWNDVRDEVSEINPKLFALIENLSPGKEYDFVRVKYPFGTNIINNGHLQLPVEKHSSDKIIENRLQSTPIPLALVLKKKCEIYIRNFNRIIPLNIINPGFFFGVFEFLDCIFENKQTDSSWNVSSGSRSIFMLPKISNASGNHKLRKEFHVQYDTPDSIEKHWQTFSSLLQCQELREQWSCEVLLFSNRWLSSTQKDISWMKFRDYVMEQGWQQSGFARKFLTTDLLHQALFRQANLRNRKPEQYSIETLKHLLAITTGTAPGFTSIDHGNQAAPTSIIKNIYTDVYGLKNHLPTIMYAGHFSDKRKVLYYSMAVPTLLSLQSHNELTSTIITQQREVKFLLSLLTENFGEYQARYNLPGSIKYEYFHNNKDELEEIQPSIYMPLDDQELIIEQEQYPVRKFCTTSQFTRGCIRITTKS